MAEKKYEGGCHCGAVRYEATVDLEKPVVACNCSMCGKKGTLLTFLQPTAFRLSKGEEALTDYLFNTENIHHLFCSTCGVTSFCRGITPKTGREMTLVNARCLDGVDPSTLTIQHVDGRSF